MGEWFCERCNVLKHNANMRCTEIKCFLCPDVDGVLRKVENNSKVEVANKASEKAQKNLGSHYLRELES